MRHHHRFATIAAAIALLAGCASSRGPQPVTPPFTRQPTLSLTGTAPSLRSNELRGRTAQSLVALFGQPALDVREGTARKLQFSGQNCVLDAYLYPPQGRGEAVVTHVDARSPDGRDADRGACIQALRRR